MRNTQLFNSLIIYTYSQSLITYKNTETGYGDEIILSIDIYLIVSAEHFKE